MEPLFFKAENRSHPRRAVGGRAGFNGAAFFQSGKCETATRIGRAQLASMEPLFFKAENVRDPGVAQRIAERASMEPLFFKAENARAFCRDSPAR